MSPAFSTVSNGNVSTTSACNTDTDDYFIPKKIKVAQTENNQKEVDDNNDFTSKKKSRTFELMKVSKCKQL